MNITTNDHDDNDYSDFIEKFNKLVCFIGDSDTASFIMTMLNIESNDELFQLYHSHRKHDVIHTILLCVDCNDYIEQYDGDLSFLSDLKKNIREYLTCLITSNNELLRSIEFDSIDDIGEIFDFLKNPPYPLIKKYESIDSIESFKKDFSELVAGTPKINNFDYIIEMYHQYESFCLDKNIDIDSLFFMYTENNECCDGFTGREHIIKELLRLYTQMKIINIPTEMEEFVKNFVDIKMKYDSTDLQHVKDSYQKQILNINITSLSELLHLKRSLNISNF